MTSSNDVIPAAPTTTGQVSVYDEKLLSGAARGLSPNELSRSVGGTLNPAECALRVRNILSDKNFWTDPERKQLLLHTAYGIVEDLKDLAKTTQDSKDYSALIRAMDLLRKILGEMEGVTEAELRALVRLQAEAMLTLIDRAMSRAREILSEDYPDLDMDIIEDAFETALLDVRET